MSQGKGRLQGRVAVVTGGASGIGRAVATLFAQEGAKLSVVDRAADAAAAVAATLGDAQALAADVAATESVDAAFAAAAERWGRIDILVNCAGVTIGGNAAETSDEVWHSNIAINLQGTFLCCRAALRRMEAQKAGTIVNIGSISAIHPGQQRAAYSASKGGVHGLTRSIAAEYAKHGIRANAIAPGPVFTPMTQARFSDPALAPQLMAMVPLGRFAQPEDIARPALFLASDDAAYVTGHILIVDGGVTIS